MAAYSVGGIGPYTINGLVSTFVFLDATCFLMGSAYGIKPLHLFYMSLVMAVLNLAKTPFTSMLLDNTRNKRGKFRPYLFTMGLPTAALLILLAYIPVDMAYGQKCVLVGLLFALLTLVQGLFAQAYEGLGQVMTPVSGERTTLMSVSALAGNLGPSVINALIPILASLWPRGLADINAYRTLIPLFSLLGLGFSFWVYSGTQERIVVPKTYVARVAFGEGMRLLLKNKHFWLLSAFQILGALRFAVDRIPGWYCEYVLGNSALFGIANIVMGTASVPGMVLAPLLCKKIEKKTLLILGSALHGVSSLLMLLCLGKTLPLFILIYVSKFAVGADFVITQSMFAEIYDLQQWKTGKRLEGFISQFNKFLIAGFGMLSGLVLPYYYERYGLGTNYEVLRQAGVHTPIFKMLVVVTAVSSALAVLPLVLYRLTAQQHQKVMEELEERAVAV
jgi:Na+/melibiose symporter-like transporter